MLKRFAPHAILLICFAVFLSPVWAPQLETVAREFRALVADRPGVSVDRDVGYSVGEIITGSVTSNRTRMTELKADTRGHFEVQAQINGRGIGVMIDTGATSVALRYEDAARLGLHVEPDDFTIPIATANGTTKAARAMLAEIRIGNVRVKNVEALIVPARALTTNLMGMSFLKRLSKVQMAGSKLVLVE